MAASRFRIDWVLVDELAIGPAPRSVSRIDQRIHSPQTPSNLPRSQ